MEALLVVGGRSMRYLFSAGDCVRFSRTEVARLKLGDIIVFLHPEVGHHFMIHRLVWKTGSGDRLRLWTKADITFGLDAPLSNVSVVGKVTAFQPLGGRWIELESAGARTRHILIGLFSTFFYRCAPEVRLRAILAALYGFSLRCPLPGAAGLRNTLERTLRRLTQ